MLALFCGLGSIGQRHLRNLQKICGIDIEIIAHRVLNRKLQVTNNLKIQNGASHNVFDGIRIFEHLDDALALKPDICFICNPTSMHLETAIAVAESGCNLFIEKPLANRLDGIAHLEKLIREKNLVAFVGYQMRFHSLIQEAKKCIDESLIGNVIFAHFMNGEYLPDWHPYEDYRQSYAGQKELGGGVALTLSHEIDLIYHFFGMPTNVYATGGQKGLLKINVEDSVSSLMEYNKTSKPFSVFLHLDYLQKPRKRLFFILGEKGKIEVDLVSCNLVVYDNNGQKLIQKSNSTVSRNQLFIDELKLYLQYVNSNEPYFDSFDDSISVMKIVKLIHASLKSRTVISS